jgi:RND family efflux transporter MFP subunit
LWKTNKFFMKKFIANNRLVFGIATAVVVLCGIYWYVRANEAPPSTIFTVGRGNVIQSVDIPGNVLAENSVDLSFEEAGQITHVYFQEGNSVPAGTTLADLNQSTLSNAVAQANAALAAAQAKLDELTTGTRPEELRIEKTAVATNQASLGAVLGSAYAAADDAVRNQTDNLFGNIQSANPIFMVPTSDSQLKINIQSERAMIGAALDTWLAATTATSSSGLASLASIANADLQQIESYLNDIAPAVNSASPNSTITASTVAGYKVNVATARNEILGSVNAVTAAEAALENAQEQLALGEAGATLQDIEAQKAAVLQAQVAVSSTRIAFDNASLKAPFAGIVRNLTMKVGQVVAPGAPVVSITNNSGLKIEAYISEIDVGKIQEGSKANITLDAYGAGTIFPGMVTTIDTAETIISLSPAYKVTLHFTVPDSRIRAGMTANAHIIVAEHDNAIEVPSRLVVGDNNQNFVLVRNGNTVEQKPVTLGITSDDGMVEVISGLAVGDTINNF